MKIAILHTSIGMVISIETDKNLDLTSNGVFVHASRLAKHGNVKSIEVNLGKTRPIRDSGLAMLLMLRELTEAQRNRIRLVNCSPDIRDVLTASRVGVQFQVS